MIRNGVTRAWICGLLLISPFLTPAVRSETNTVPFSQVKTFLSTASFFPRGLSESGKGGAGTSGIDNFISGYNNPASLAWRDLITLQSSINDYYYSFISFTDTRISGGFDLPGDNWMRNWRVGGALAYSSQIHDIPPSRTIYMPTGTAKYSHTTDHCLSVTVAERWKWRALEAGLGQTARYFENRIPIYISGWAFDLGTIALLDISSAGGFHFRPRLGASIINLSGDIDLGGGSTAELKEKTRYGLGLDFFLPPTDMYQEHLKRKISGAALSIDFDLLKGHNTDEIDGWSAGLEIVLLEIVHLRLGDSKDVYSSYKHRTYGFGAGWDSGKWMIQLDYAHISNLGLSYITSSAIDVYGITLGWRI